MHFFVKNCNRRQYMLIKLTINNKNTIKKKKKDQENNGTMTTLQQKIKREDFNSKRIE